MGVVEDISGALSVSALSFFIPSTPLLDLLGSILEHSNSRKITPELLLQIFGAPLEELQEKHGVGP